MLTNKKLQSIISTLPEKSRQELLKILKENPKLELLFLEMYKRKRQAFELNDAQLLDKYQTDEERFILKKFNQFLNEGKTKNNSNS